jgi:hypothetical protein
LVDPAGGAVVFVDESLPPDEHPINMVNEATAVRIAIARRAIA